MMARSSVLLGVIAGLSLIGGMVTGFLVVWILALVASVLALVLGYRGKNQTMASPGMQDQLDVAMAGIVVGWLVLSLTVLILLFIGITSLGA